jgi:hypothetical protein
MCAIELGDHFVIQLPDDLESLIAVVWLRHVLIQPALMTRGNKSGSTPA